MRTTRRLLALAWVAPLFFLSCATQPSGQVMIVIQNGVSIPKDIDKIQIEVSYVNTGAVAYQRDFKRFGDGDGAILLPATLGFTSPEKDPTQPIRVRVIASRGTIARYGTVAGGEVSNVRILREAVTTVPTDRVAELPLPLEFLCDGLAEIELNDQGLPKLDDFDHVIVKNRGCNENQTCIAGECKDLQKPVLKDYDATQFFGGGDGKGNGICFDTVSCLEGGTEAPLDLDRYKKDKMSAKENAKVSCFAKASGAINVGLRTQGGGICGANGCYVALDASSDSGWKPGPTAGTIELPTAVCEKAEHGEIAGVIQSPMSATACSKKTESIPTCGPWSAVGVYKPPAATAPIAIASGQQSPASLARDEVTGVIYWTARGSFDAQGMPDGTGSVKAIDPGGGGLVTLAAAEKAPHGLTFDPGLFAIWTDASTGEIRWAPRADAGVKLEAKTLLIGRLQPEGVSLLGKKLFWTELAGNKVYSVSIDTQKNGQDLVLTAGTATEIGTTSGSAPRAIAAAADVTCWTYEDKLMSATGSVVCALPESGGKSEAQVVADKQNTPRALLLMTDASGNATSVVWANFDLASNGGGVFQIPLKGGPTTGQQPVTVAKDDYPSGIALDPDGKTIYWSSRSRGAVSRCTLSKLSECDAMKASIATGQKNPGAIVVDDKAVYWVNEGTGDKPDGAIMKLSKTAPTE